MQISGERAGQFVRRNPDRLVDPSKAVFGQQTIPRLAQDQADCRLVGGVLQSIVDDVAVKVELARVLRLELPRLQIDHHERPQSQVIEQQIDVEVLVPDIQTVLSTDKREPLAQFQQELFQMLSVASSVNAARAWV